MFKEKEVFTKCEEVLLLTKCNEVRQIIEILKDKDIHSFRIFLSCLRELKQDDLIADLVNLSSKYTNILLQDFKYFLQK